MGSGFGLQLLILLLFLICWACTGPVGVGPPSYTSVGSFHFKHCFMDIVFILPSFGLKHLAFCHDAYGMLPSVYGMEPLPQVGLSRWIVLGQLLLCASLV